MRDSIVFYRSFYEAIKGLPPDDQIQVYSAIFEYALNDTEIDSSGIAKAVFTLVKPQIDKNNKRYENGSKGGRPTNKSQEEQQQMRKDRNSQQYLKWRDAVYERDEYTCKICGSKEHIEAHHIKEFADYPDLRFDTENGITLCSSCHSKIHSEKNQSDNFQNQTKPNCKSEKPNVNVNVNVNVNDNDNVNDKKIKRSTFVPPISEDVIGYCAENGLKVDADRFVDFYESKDWMIGKNKMKSWKAAVRNWARQDKVEQKKNKFNNFEQRDTNFSSLEGKLLGGRP